MNSPIDMTESIAPRSDQANAEDFLSGPRTFTIAEVRRGSTAEQPIDIVLAEFPEGRPFKPSKTVRRILVAAWGADGSTYIGKRMTLFRDDTVRFGGAAVGGIRVSHLSHIDKPMTISLTETRGKRRPHHIQPLPDGPPAITPDAVAEFEARITGAATLDELSNIAADLKALDLGVHKKPLLAAWSERQTALKEGE